MNEFLAESFVFATTRFIVDFFLRYFNGVCNFLKFSSPPLSLFFGIQLGISQLRVNIFMMFALDTPYSCMFTI